MSRRFEEVLKKELDLAIDCKNLIVESVEGIVKQPAVEVVRKKLNQNQTLSRDEFHEASDIIQNIKTLLSDIWYIIEEKTSGYSSSSQTASVTEKSNSNVVERDEDGGNGRAAEANCIDASSPPAMPTHHSEHGSIDHDREQRTHQLLAAASPGDMPPIVSPQDEEDELPFKLVPVTAPAARLLRLEKGTKLEIVVTEVKSPNFFYFQQLYAKTEHRFLLLQNWIMEFINEHGANIKVRPPLLYGQLVIAKYSVDDSYYRARVEDPRLKTKNYEQTVNWSTEDILVYFIDYGNKDFVKLDDMYRVETKIHEYPVYATTGALYDIGRIDYDADEIDWFCQTVRDVKVECVVKEVRIDGRQVLPDAPDPVYGVELSVRLPDGAIFTVTQLFNICHPPPSCLPVAGYAAADKPYPPAATPHPPTAPPQPPTATPQPPTTTPYPPTATPHSPTATPHPPTATTEPPIATPDPPVAAPGVYALSKRDISPPLIDTDDLYLVSADFAPNWQDYIMWI